MANNEDMDAQPEILGIIDITKSYLYEEIWKLCAGPSVDIPTTGSEVYYFPQGNIQHINESTKEDLDTIKSFLNLPTKIRCEVVNIKLEVEKTTEEVYAQISLIPYTTKNNICLPYGNRPRPIIQSFTKVLTVSDTTTHSGLFIPKKHAKKCFPPLDWTKQTQELVVKDLHGYEWRFKHTFRGKPRRHLFTAGWSAFTTSKRLVTGDSVIFIRGENGELRVGIRRANHQQCNMLSSVISTECMHHGVIASTKFAINNNCVFTVMYKPRLSQFVVSFEKYLKAMEKNFHAGSRFMMRFEGGDFADIRYSGTVIGVTDLSPHWKNSEWRSLEVQWDDQASITRPDKVSPWELEPLGNASNVHQSALLKNKRSHQVIENGSTSSHPWIQTLNQGQEIGQSSKRPHISIPHLSCCDAVEESKIPSGWLMTMPKPNINDQMLLPIKKRMIIDATSSCRYFRVHKVTTPSGNKEHIRPINSHQKFEISKLSKETTFHHIQTLTSPKAIESKQVNSIRTRTKVQMQGVAIVRTVDLALLDGYNPLIDKLEKLFDLKDELRTHNQWEIVFTDGKGDMMLVGDYPWPKFCNMAKKLFICSKEEVKKMKSENKLS